MTAHNWWMLVPVRGFGTGKSRLAAVLDAQARTVLNRHLLTHTLEAIAEARGDLAQCLVVSPCEQALACARETGAQVLQEPAGGGLNAALTLGLRHARALGATRALIIACDLPDLSGDALNELIRLADGNESAVLAPDRSGDGTNALAIDAAACDAFHFGESSRALHVAALARAGQRCVLCRREELAFDLDMPRDYAEWMARCGARIPRGLRAPARHRIVETEK